MKTAIFTGGIARWGVWLLALCPCLTALGFQFQDPKPSLCAIPADRPALAFDQYAVNLGPIEPMGVVQGHFRFTNRSDRMVKVTNLKPSCGCLQPRLEKREYAPGETGMFDVNVATAGEMPGPREYTITLEYEDPQPRSVTLTFRLELPPRQIYISPRAVLVYQFGDEPVTREIAVTDNRPNAATVTAVESRAKFVTGEIARTERNADGSKTTLVKVRVSGIASGTQNSVVRIHTDDPQFPVLNVPVRVQRQSPPNALPKSQESNTP